MKARIIIGSTYGDEGKGTVVARYTKESDNVLNVLTNGGSQRGHSILTKDGNITYHHFGSGTYYNADTYYSCFFILNPVQFAKEHLELVVKPKNIMRDKNCKWTTIYDMMANSIEHQLKGTHATCGAGIWTTIKRYRDFGSVKFDEFMKYDMPTKLNWLNNIKKYYEHHLTIPDNMKILWNSEYMATHFIMDCAYFKKHTIVKDLKDLEYQNLIFENGQGLLLSDTGKDTYDTTPSNTGIHDSLILLNEMGILNSNGVVDGNEISAHYVSRPYLTRHGDGEMLSQTDRKILSKDVLEDRTNQWNEFQGEFRYGELDIEQLKNRIITDAKDIPFEIELTHCDEMDRVGEFKKMFDKVNVYDTPIV